QDAQYCVELAQVAGMEIDGEFRVTGQRVSAQWSMHLKLAVGHVNFKFAQLHGAIALSIGSIQKTAGGGFPKQRMAHLSKAQPRGAADCVGVSVGPGCGGGAVED